MTLRIAIVGATGRMGTEAVQAVNSADDLQLVHQLDEHSELSVLTRETVDVALDFTHPDAVMDTARACAVGDVHLVIGTSGVDAARQAELRTLFTGDLGVIVVPNFALGAVLAMRFARQAARFFAGIEIIELHHPGKADAPSGTAAATAAAIAEARRAAGSPPMPDATTSDPDGARGAELDGVHVHSVRLPGLIAHQEVLLGNEGELLTIRHDSLHRSSFMPGVLLALREAPRRPGLTIGLEPLLGLD